MKIQQSRNQREGRYAGKWDGKHERSKSSAFWLKYPYFHVPYDDCDESPFPQTGWPLASI